MLATLYNVFRDQAGLSAFGFANADLHLRQNEAIHRRFGLDLPYYVLDPIPPRGAGFESWLLSHQNIHIQTNAVLGIAGYDLRDVDFTSPDQLASWIWLHAQEHVQASNKLGLTG